MQDGWRMQLSLLILPNSHFSQRSDILWRRRSWKIPLVRVFTICQGSIAAHEGALLRSYEGRHRTNDACLSRRFPGSGASHSFTQEAFLASSVLLHCSSPFFPACSDQILSFVLSVGCTDAESEAERAKTENVSGCRSVAGRSVEQASRRSPRLGCIRKMAA